MGEGRNVFDTFRRPDLMKMSSFAYGDLYWWWWIIVGNDLAVNVSAHYTVQSRILYINNRRSTGSVFGRVFVGLRDAVP